MDEEIQKPEPKISDVEIILIGIFYLGLDAIDFIPAAGDITDIIAAPMGFYYWMKGLNGTAFIASEAIEAIPGAQEFPFVRTITWGINIWLDRHPKLEATFAQVEQVGNMLEGDTAGAESSGGSLDGGRFETAPATATVTADRTEGQTAGSTSETSEATDTAERGKPSEESTERDLNQNKKASEQGPEQQGSSVDAYGNEAGGENEEGEGPISDEERRKEAGAQAYNKLVTPETMQDPIDVVKEKELSDRVVPIDQKQSNSERLLKERLARLQQRQSGQSKDSTYEDRAA